MIGNAVLFETTVREVQYEDEFTNIVATIPTRALDVYAAFLATPLSAPVDDAAPASVG